MVKQGVRRLVVPKSKVWKGMSKRFSILYNGKWLKNIDKSSSNNNLLSNVNNPSSSSTSTFIPDKFCCLSREDIIRFLIGCLGALAPLPLSSICSLDVISLNYTYIEASLPALKAAQNQPGDTSAVAIVEVTPDGNHKLLGEISASKLWKCDYLAAAWDLANLSAGQFVTGVEDNNIVDVDKQRKFSLGFGFGKSLYRGRSAPLTCKATSSLAAVMAQMLSHRATHVWVTQDEDEDEDDDVLVGVVGYADILDAVTKPPTAFIPATRSIVELVSEIQS